MMTTTTLMIRFDSILHSSRAGLAKQDPHRRRDCITLQQHYPLFTSSQSETSHYRLSRIFTPHNSTPLLRPCLRPMRAVVATRTTSLLRSTIDFEPQSCIDLPWTEIGIRFLRDVKAIQRRPNSFINTLLWIRHCIEFYGPILVGLVLLK